MPRGLWKDFRDKYGFSDGDKVCPVDLSARDRIVAILNKELKGRGITALAYDRLGLHNYCLLLVLPNPGGKTSRSQLLKHFVKDTNSMEIPLPPYIAKRTEEIVAQAYEEVGWVSAKRATIKRGR
jgi:hypothetical protein